MCSILKEFDTTLSEFCENIAVLSYNSEHGSIDQITYEKVNEWCIKLHSFFERNITNKSCVALLLPHHMFIPSVIISLHKAGHSFVFLDYYASKEEIKTNVEFLNIKWLITLKDINLESFHTADCIIFHEYYSLELKTSNKEQTALSLEHICYVVCSSGTTGQKKIIRVPDTCILSNVLCLKKIFNITHSDVIYYGTALTFDPSIVELFLALFSGATLLIVPKKVRFNPRALFAILFPDTETNTYKGVTFLQMTPSLFLRWTLKDIEYMFTKTSLKTLALGGEEFPKCLVGIPRKDLKLFNLYGITEVSCWASIMEIKNEEAIDLGISLDDTVLEVRNNGSQIKEGEGELFIGSSKRFTLINDELMHHSMVFRSTGDLVRIKHDKIYYLGRMNDVIKRYGVKIHLTQIETSIFNSLSLENKCVWYEEKHKLILFVLIKDTDLVQRSRTADKIRIHLLHELPPGQFPDRIEIVASFPLTSNGKVDKARLLQIYTESSEKLPGNAADVFDVLISRYFGVSIENVDNNLTLFQIGGNSILIMQLVEELRQFVEAEKQSKLITLLLEMNLLQCKEYLQQFGCSTHKRKLEKEAFIPKRPHTVRKSSDASVSIVWKYDFKACVDCSPVIMNKDSGDAIVATGSFSHIFASLNAKSGREISKLVLPDAIEIACCPAVSEKEVFIGCFDGKMYCISLTSGTIIWEYLTSDRIKCTPCYCLNNSAIVFGSYDKYVHCVNSETGTLIWKIAVGGGVTSSPVVKNSRIFIATITGRMLCIEEETGSILWDYVGESPIFGSPCLISNNADIICWPSVIGVVYCLSQNDGKVVWSYTAGGHIYSSLLQHDDNIIFGCHDHNIYCVSLFNQLPVLKYKTPANSAISSTCTVMNQLLLVATISGTIVICDITSGDILTTYSLPGEVFSSPCVYNDLIYLGCRDNNLYCLQVENKEK